MIASIVTFDGQTDLDFYAPHLIQTLERLLQGYPPTKQFQRIPSHVVERTKMPVLSISDNDSQLDKFFDNYGDCLLMILELRKRVKEMDRATRRLFASELAQDIDFAQRYFQHHSYTDINTEEAKAEENDPNKELRSMVVESTKWISRVAYNVP